MPRDVGTEEAILDAVIARIDSQLTEAVTADNIRLCLDWNQPPMTAGSICFLVGPGDGLFDQDLIEGGGAAQATFKGEIIVGIYTPIQIDIAQRHDHALKDATRGLLPLWRKVVKALLGWSPGVADSELTRNPLLPSQRHFVTSSDGRKWHGVLQTFLLDYDVDLT